MKQDQCVWSKAIVQMKETLFKLTSLPKSGTTRGFQSLFGASFYGVQAVVSTLIERLGHVLFSY